jgi:cyclomaltodextrinase
VSQDGPVNQDGPVREPDWVTQAVWWHLYPLGFVGAESAAETGADGVASGPVRHRLDRIAGWLDYAVDLGVSGLMLGPVFASSTHGYDTVDHHRVDPRLGDDADLEALIAAAHRRGMRVVLDGVFNHVGRRHPAFVAALAAGPGSADAALFGLRWPQGSSGPPVWSTFEGHDLLVGLDHDEPAVSDLVAGVMNRWLDAGADGWRLDAAYAVPDRFWAAVLPRVRAAHPDAYVFGEVIHGDYPGRVRASTLDAVTQYELWKAVWSGLNDRNLFELAHALDRHDGYLDTFVPQTFIGNHDVTRIASRLDDPRHLPHAVVVLLTTGGTPSVYAGDEQAFTGVKEERAGGDDAIRPAFPAEGPSGLAPFGWPTYHLHRELIGLRRRRPWLHRARTTTVHLANRTLVYRTAPAGTGDGADGALLVGLNLDDEPVDVAVPGGGALLAGSGDRGAAGAGRVRLDAHGWGIWD